MPTSPNKTGPAPRLLRQPSLDGFGCSPSSIRNNNATISTHCTIATVTFGWMGDRRDRDDMRPCYPRNGPMKGSIRFGNVCSLPENLANDECLGSRPEHRISRNDQTAVLFGADGDGPPRSATSLRFVIPIARTRPRVGECGPQWRWNRSPIVTPEYRLRESRRAVSVSLSVANRVPMPKATTG